MPIFDSYVKNKPKKSNSAYMMKIIITCWNIPSCQMNISPTKFTGEKIWFKIFLHTDSCLIHDIPFINFFKE